MIYCYYMTNDKLRTTNIWKPQFLPNIIWLSKKNTASLSKRSYCKFHDLQNCKNLCLSDSRKNIRWNYRNIPISWNINIIIVAKFYKNCRLDLVFWRWFLVQVFHSSTCSMTDTKWWHELIKVHPHLNLSSLWNIYNVHDLKTE
jgi:hypothetical protein